MVVTTLEEPIGNKKNALSNKELSDNIKLKYHKMSGRDTNFIKNEGEETYFFP